MQQEIKSLTNNTMVKIRLQGTKSDINNLVALLKKNKGFQLNNVSDIYDNKGTNRNKRLYCEAIFPKPYKLTTVADGIKR